MPLTPEPRTELSTNIVRYLHLQSMHSTAALLVSGLALVSAKPALTTVSADYDFAQYVQDFKLHEQAAKWASSASELTLRKSMFDTEVSRINSHNSQTHNSYQIGLNRFSLLTAEEKKASMGHNKAMRQAHAKVDSKYEVRKGKERKGQDVREERREERRGYERGEECVLWSTILSFTQLYTKCHLAQGIYIYHSCYITPHHITPHRTLLVG